MGIKKVQEFHAKFELPQGAVDCLSHDEEATEFRANFMQEELNEFKTAWESGDRVKMFDALLDLEYVVHGTALFMGIDPTQWKDGQRAVHRANMAKERAMSKDQSKRGTTLDVVKPAGWYGPEATLREILGE